MASDYDIYNDYPELRDLKPRHSGGSGRGKKKKRKVKNSVKLVALVLLIAVALVIVSIAAGAFGSASEVVYNRDGSIKTVSSAEAEKLLSQGWFKTAAEIVPVTLYAEDGSSISAVMGDVSALEEKGYSRDKSAVFSTLYAENGDTLYVPSGAKSSYVADGWHEKLSDITKTLYKSDGSKITVMNAEAPSRIAEGWSDKLLDVAKKMVSETGEEKFVFNDEVDKYEKEGWQIVKRVVDPDQPMVALTFDDGPGKFTNRLLDCLEENNSVATFFTLGYLVETYPDVVKRASELGCEIGNHTWEHTNLTSVDVATAVSVVQKTSDKVEEIIGKPTKTYRPCYGSYNNEVLSAIDLPAIMWSIDTLDWKTRNADSTYNKIMSDVYDGAIILMHDIHEPTVNAAVRVIPELIKQGYQLVTVEELLEYKRGGMENGKVYFDAFE